MQQMFSCNLSFLLVDFPHQLGSLSRINNPFPLFHGKFSLWDKPTLRFHHPPVVKEPTTVNRDYHRGLFCSLPSCLSLPARAFFLGAALWLSGIFHSLRRFSFHEAKHEGKSMLWQQQWRPKFDSQGPIPVWEKSTLVECRPDENEETIGWALAWPAFVQGLLSYVLNVRWSGYETDIRARVSRFGDWGFVLANNTAWKVLRYDIWCWRKKVCLIAGIRNQTVWVCVWLQ